MTKAILITLTALTILLSGCAASNNVSTNTNKHIDTSSTTNTTTTKSQANTTPSAQTTSAPNSASAQERTLSSEPIRLLIGETELSVAWENNDSVKALEEIIAEKPLTIALSQYGGFEQVGQIRQNLPRNDAQTTAGPGDIMLYSGNQIVLFYGSNSWAYTKLGHINMSPTELGELLGKGDVEIKLK